jgi:hypothetical protein
MPVRLISATYSASSTFIIPEGVVLLDEYDNSQANMQTVGSWWIKWDVLYYVQKVGVIKEIHGIPDEGERKRPETVEVHEDD